MGAYIYTQLNFHLAVESNLVSVFSFILLVSFIYNANSPNRQMVKTVNDELINVEYYFGNKTT